MKYLIVLLAAALTFLVEAPPAAAGPNPNVKFAMHLVASDDYLTCDDLTPATWQEIDGSLTVEELAVSNYSAYVTFIAYDLGSCFHCVEYFVTGWPMSRGAPPLPVPDYCLEALVIGNPIEAHGGSGGIACLVGHTCIGDPVSHLAPFAFVRVDLAAHTDYLPIELRYEPSSQTYPDDPHNYVLGPEPQYIEDPVVEERGCVIGTGGGGQRIELVAPNGGETLYAGATPPIEWTATGIQAVRLEYTTDGGNTWDEIVSSMPSSRFYLWTVPNEPSGRCRVRISDAGDGVPSDESEGFFEIACEHARTVRVPADYPTIQYGIWAAAPEDTVRVAPGVYPESVVMKDRVALVSEETRDATVIDATGRLHGVVFHWQQVDTALLRGFTITGGDANGVSFEDQCGGGILIVATGALIQDCVVAGNRANIDGGGIGGQGPLHVTIEDCLIRDNFANTGGGMDLTMGWATVLRTRIYDNTATENGGGVFCHHNSSEFVDCILAGNSCPLGGGMYACSESSPTLMGCTFWGNSGTNGGGLACGYNSFPVLHRTLIAGSKAGPSVYCIQCSIPILSCCDIYGNAGGDWVDCIKPQMDQNGNFRKDPLLCDPSGYDFHLECSSPCADAYGCGRIGALGVGCGASRVEPTTWSSLKARYRGNSEKR